MTSFTDDSGTTKYSYDKATDNLTEAKKDCGNGNVYSVGYTYSDDGKQLNSITHNDTSYNLTYDVFGNRTSSKVGSQPLATYTYSHNNGPLIKMTYGTEHTIGYICNALNEENIDGWFTDEEWSDFQDKIVKLKAALDVIGTDVTYPWKDEGKRQALTDAFHALLRSYNTMTNRNAIIGDVNGNGTFDIDNVTLIQKYLAEMCDLNGAQKMRSAVYANRTYEKLRVSDVTQLQLYLAELIDQPIDSWSYDYVFVSEVPLNPLINEDFLMERMFNFNICPRNDMMYDIQNGFYSTQHFIQPMLEFPYDMSAFE